MFSLSLFLHWLILPFYSHTHTTAAHLNCKINVIRFDQSKFLLKEAAIGKAFHLWHYLVVIDFYGICIMCLRSNVEWMMNMKTIYIFIFEIDFELCFDIGHFMPHMNDIWLWHDFLFRFWQLFEIRIIHMQAVDGFPKNQCYWASQCYWMPLMMVFLCKNKSKYLSVTVCVLSEHVSLFTTG